MSVVTIEAVVEDSLIRLPSTVRLPDQTKVYVVIPGIDVAHVVRIASPRFQQIHEATDFTLEIRDVL